MYGCEKIAVVKPTNAVSATRNTLNGSTKKSLPATSSGPVEITRTVSAPAASSVRPQAITLTIGASSRSPITASRSAPASGMPRTARISIMRRARLFPFPLGFLQLLEMLEIEAVELFPGLEKEHAPDQH